MGENPKRSGGRRERTRHPNLSDRKGKSQSLLTQVLDKGRFLRLGQSTTLTPARNLELRCKGTNMGWSYPTYLDTFNDSRLRCCEEEEGDQESGCESLTVFVFYLQHQAE